MRDDCRVVRSSSPPVPPDAPHVDDGRREQRQHRQCHRRCDSRCEHGVLEETAAAFEAAGVDNAERWPGGRGVPPLRRLGQLAKLRDELAKYNIDDDTFERIISVLEASPACGAVLVARFRRACCPWPPRPRPGPPSNWRCCATGTASINSFPGDPGHGGRRIAIVAFAPRRGPHGRPRGGSAIAGVFGVYEHIASNYGPGRSTSATPIARYHVYAPSSPSSPPRRARPPLRLRCQVGCPDAPPPHRGTRQPPSAETPHGRVGGQGRLAAEMGVQHA